MPSVSRRASSSNLQGYLEVLVMVKSDVLAARGGITMGRAMGNSAIVATTYTLGSVFLASLAGFAFAKMRFKGRGVLFILMLATMMIPASVGLIPNYMIMAKFKWMNTWWPLIIPAGDPIRRLLDAPVYDHCPG